MTRSLAVLGSLLVSMELGARAAPASAAADRDAPADSPLIERVTTELVLIEVYVTGTDGRPVRGLGRDDFILKVDRRRKPIGSLEFVEAAPEAEVPSPMPPGAPEDTATPPPAARYPRRFVLFFEDAVSSFFDQTEARRAAVTFLTTRLTPEDQVSIVAYNHLEKLRVLHDFSTDRDSLSESVRRSIENPRRHSDYASQLDERYREIRRARPDGSTISPGGPGGGGGFAMGRSEVGRLANSYARDDIVRMGPILTSLRTLVEALAPWPGYKAIVFLGHGIPEYPMEDYASLGEDSFNLSLEMMGLARAAATSNISLHTLQTSGIVAGPGQASARRRTNSLKTLALNSGGLVSTSNDLLQGLVEVDTKNRAYYLLGYVPQGPPDGLYHSVTVKVKHSNARARHRDGFRRLPPAELHQKTVQAAHLLPELHPLAGLELTIVPGPRSYSGRLNDLVLYVPASGVVFLAEEGRLTARFELGIVAIDENGKDTYRIDRKIEIALPPDMSSTYGLGLNLFSRVPLPAREQTVTAVLADLQGGTIGAARVTLSPPAAGEHRLSGLSIYSLAQSSLWIDVSEEASGDGETGIIQSYERGPALKSRFAPGESVACGFKLPEATAADAPRLQIVVVSGEQVVRAKPVELTDGKMPSGSMKVTVPVEGLATGDYFLLVRQETADGNRERGRLSFHIEPTDGVDIR
jgi:VWFA-related protein